MLCESVEVKGKREMSVRVSRPTCQYFLLRVNVLGMCSGRGVLTPGLTVEGVQLLTTVVAARDGLTHI